MYVSRLTFHVLPGRTDELGQALKRLAAMVNRAGGDNVRVLRTHYASLGAPDVVFEQEAPDLATLEEQIAKVTKDRGFQRWSDGVSDLLAESPKREIYLAF